MSTKGSHLQSHPHPGSLLNPCLTWIMQTLNLASPDFPCSRLSFSPDAYYLQYEMLVLIDIGRTWLKFVSHSLLFTSKVQRFFSDFFPFFNPKNRKPSYLCGVKHETGSLFKATSDVFLFNSDNWALLYYSPSPSALGFCHVRSSWQLTNCWVKVVLPHKIPDPAIRREKTSVSKYREAICLDSLLFR